MVKRAAEELGKEAYFGTMINDSNHRVELFFNGETKGEVRYDNTFVDTCITRIVVIDIIDQILSKVYWFYFQRH